jgi:heme ABC exporter ATP-binding subunit CcmA
LPAGQDAPTQPPAIAVERLRKEYDLRPVLRDVTFSLAAGRTLALLGPNGAGKTTFLRILATLTRPSGGAARMNGRDIVRDADAIRRAVGYVGHAPLLYDELSASENLQFFARMYGLRDGAERAAELLDQVGLRSQARAQVRTLSRGQAQRLALARALIHHPAVLLLDEPDTGLDDAGLRLLDQVLRQRQAHGQTTVLATHAHAWGLSLADEALVLLGGRVAHAGPAAELNADEIAVLYALGQQSRRGGGR